MPTKDITKTSLYKAFQHTRDEIGSEDLDKLKGIVCTCNEKAGTILEQIKKTFKQYTLHDLTHSYNVADRVYDLLPKGKKNQIPLTALELTILWAAILLHDIGMAVTDQEKQEILESEGFRIFFESKRAVEEQRQERHRAYDHQLAMLAEYVRQRHEVRSKKEVERNFSEILSFNGLSLTGIVGELCESHGWGVNYSNDVTDARKCVERLELQRSIPGQLINERYLACCLRLGDILDFDHTRAPELAMDYIHFTEDKSVQEWQKHLGVDKIDTDEHQVKLFGTCRTTQQYVDVNVFTDWIDRELQECLDLLDDKTPSDIRDKGYVLNLCPVVRRRIKLEDERYVAGSFKFQLEYDEILRLLMDKALYPDPALFLRELLQNSLDACRVQEAITAQYNKNHPDDTVDYRPHITVFDYSEDAENPRIVFQDNGIGMSEEIVKNYFLRVGKSYYRSEEYKQQQLSLEKDNLSIDACSNFGIGFLSCFMVGDRIKVETYRDGCQPLEIQIDGANKYFTIKHIPTEPNRGNRFYKGEDPTKDGPFKYPGTKITVEIDPRKWEVKKALENDQYDFCRESIDKNAGLAARTLKTFAVNVDYPISIFKYSPHQETVATLIQAYEWEQETPPLPEGCPEFWRKYLVPIRIPFEEYEETKDIRGNTWIWFLNDGTGKPTFQKGLLKIDTYIGNINISIKHPIIEYYCKLQRKSDIDTLSNIKKLPIEDDWDSNPLFKNEDVRFTFTLENKKLFLGLFENNYHIEDWNYNNGDYDILPENLVIHLFQNDFQSVLEYSKKQTIYLHYRIDLPQNQIAIHGLLLPSGITEFNPIEGEISKYEMLNQMFILSCIDLRRNNLISPNASRLNISYNDSCKTIESVNYRTLKTLEKKMTTNDLFTLFEDGLGEEFMVKALLYAWTKQEFRPLYENLSFTVYTKGQKKRELGLQKTIAEFGEWVPEGDDSYISSSRRISGVIACNIRELIRVLPTRNTSSTLEYHVGTLLDYFK